MEGSIKAALDLLRFVAEKDIFEGYYKQHLAKRLLQDRTVNEDIERMVISNLKVSLHRSKE